MAFTKSMSLAVSKDVFLSNKRNKQKFIHMLGEELCAIGCEVVHEQADADFTIAQKNIQNADTMAAVLVGDDTDLQFYFCIMQVIKTIRFFLHQNQKRIQNLAFGIWVKSKEN